MIYEFAIEPELAATWHNRSVAHPFVSQLGPGESKVACAFPVRKWRDLVVDAFKALFPSTDTPEWQTAQKNIEILLRHLEQTGTSRDGGIAHGETWLAAAQREHGQYPFGGILVATSQLRRDYLVVADRLGIEEFAAWNPPSPPVTRQAKELAAALAPLLRCASCVRFIDPYFDAGIADFFDPMKEFLSATQRRRSPKDLEIEVHFGVRPEELAQARRRDPRVTEIDLAKAKLQSAHTQIIPLLQRGVVLRIRAWSSLAEKLHNRYVLTNIGGVLLGTGLDRARVGSAYTDDLAVLSKEQFMKRWSQYGPSTTDFRLIDKWDGKA